MGLTKADVIRSTQRLLCFFNPTESQIEVYASAIIEVMGWMQPDHFEIVCVEMLKDATLSRRPVPQNYLFLYHKLEVERGWKKKEPKICTGCNGLKFVFAWYRNKNSGENIRAMKPCPLCRPPAVIKDELEEIDDQSESLRKQWEKLGDGSKSHALDYAEALSKMCGRPDYLENFLKKVVAPE